MSQNIMKLIAWNFSVIFFILLTANVVKNNHIEARILFIFLKNVPKQIEFLLILIFNLN